MTSHHTSFFLLTVVGMAIYNGGVAANPVLLRQTESRMLATNVLRSKTSLTARTTSDRLLCGDDQVVLPSRVDTTQRVANLRKEMETHNLEAYIIPSNDEHQSEYVATADERLKYISGFSKSPGIAIITKTQQALWTYERYFLQAEYELDCNWILMKDGAASVQTMLEWFQTLPSGPRVGADSKLIDAQIWQILSEQFKIFGIEMVEVEENLVDLIWETDNRPDYPSDPIFIHELKYAGKSWQDKVKEVQIIMTENQANMLILTALDEIAWLLNLRGNDIPYNPVFRSYVTVTANEVNLFVPTNKTKDDVWEHFGDGGVVKISEYNNFWTHLSTATGKVIIPQAHSYATGASYAVLSKIKAESRMVTPSPVILMKAQKNEVEIEGMKNAHVKDAVALCDFLSFMETEITSGNPWTELSAATKLSQYRAMQEGAMGDSFATTSGFGPNSAIIHYEPSAETDAKLTESSIYLLDSGGQYLDGTTDVTRTVHYGKPTSLMIETYTRVLMGHIDLATAVFPKEILDTSVDILARKPLYEIGLDYNHATGHGIGMFLSILEAPTNIDILGTGNPFQLGYFFSVEPGYYRDHEFGIRLENIMMVIEKDTKYSTQPMFAFEPVTLVPFEAKLINTTLLNKMQCDWLNSYHKKVLDVVGKELVNQNRTKGYKWLKTKTEPLCVSSAPGTLTISLLPLLVALYTSTIYQIY
ncbi:xaa-Pro aminopeptidase 1-like isoform X3 [Macrobrachium rosenbergii]|uniref:xaa-Pro aminopeptidase 1-like isoform X3 n=1 Tax=Macrobrachium rosenbergii TaxID=79674 RepID=UPI0034D66D72